ncbi:hypothetical protein [uncultured Roseibium sp.]|uniref:hypothetical protein n=1 Tax=uncultured Roseibium sp. TaxID=1936171 RepID=UPI0026019AEE|nr:hypothetical protein [uncultured Roseibium sp.]
MSLTSTVQADDPTIEALGKSDRRLGILCAHCGRFRYMNGSRFSQDQKVSTLSGLLSCNSCGSKDVAAIAVSRNPENGYWPAEHS